MLTAVFSFGIVSRILTPYLQIIPTSLDNLLTLSDIVQEFSTKVDGMNKCHGCGKKGSNLIKCSQCSMFWYCGKVSSLPFVHTNQKLMELRKACQTKGWTVEGHKAHCKLLMHPDLQIMFHLDWDRFDNFVEFPRTGGASHSGPRTDNSMGGGCVPS